MTGSAVVVHSEDYCNLLRFFPVLDSIQQKPANSRRRLPVRAMPQAEIRWTFEGASRHALRDDIVEQVVFFAFREDIQITHVQRRTSSLSFFGAPPINPLYQRVPSGMSSG